MTTLTEEDRRALAYQAQQRRRAASEVALNRSLAGNPAAAQDLRDAWAPVVLARLEARQTSDQPEEGTCNVYLSQNP